MTDIQSCVAFVGSNEPCTVLYDVIAQRDLAMLTAGAEWKKTPNHPIWGENLWGHPGHGFHAWAARQQQALWTGIKQEPCGKTHVRQQVNYDALPNKQAETWCMYLFALCIPCIPAYRRFPGSLCFSDV